MLEHYPDLVILTNNGGRHYLDQAAFRHGFVAMQENVGEPSEWDDLQSRMRDVCGRAYNLPWWGWYDLTEEGSLWELCYATTITNRGSDVCGRANPPSLAFVQFAHRFPDYLLGDYVDTCADPSLVALVGTPASARVVVNRRTLVGGRQELILHLFNIDPAVPAVEGGEVQVNTAGLNLDRGPAVTLLSPEADPRPLEAQVADGKLIFALPRVPL